MIRKTVSGIILVMLLIGMLTSLFNVQIASSSPKFMPEVTVSPKHPTTDDYVNVSVSFTLYSWPPYVKEFGPLIRDGNAFSINVTIYVPSPDQIVLFIVHTDQNTYNLGKLSKGVYLFQVYVYHAHYTEGIHYLAIEVPFIVTEGPPAATLDIDSNTLHLRSVGQWITAYIEPMGGWDLNEINVSSIMLNNAVPAGPISSGDYDIDAIPDFTVKFDRAQLIHYILANVNMTELLEEKPVTITLTVTGKLDDGTLFQGSNTLRIMWSMPKYISYQISPI